MLNIFPIDLRLRMMTDNAAFRLYRLQRTSQVLARLGDQWKPAPGFHAPTPTRSKAKTTLRTLATRAAPDGPRIEAYPDSPSDAPHWDRKVTFSPLTQLDEPEVQTNMRTTIFLNAPLTNKGRQDDWSIGAAAAALYYKGREWGHLESIFGGQVTKVDAEIGALQPALMLLSNFLSTTPHTGPVLLVTKSRDAVGRYLDIGRHPNQHFALEHAYTVDKLLTTHPDTSLSFRLARQDLAHIGFKRTRHLLLEAIK
ncbi:hypothetical protein BJV74DRAFT_446865 [Russula compacta]|nr:hypothetical protein BJV74DRAFT_446865 [Russula compacta]